MLARLKARAATDGFNVETRTMDGSALEFEDNSFDVVGSQFGVMLFPDMPRGISEMARVVRRGGRVLMTVYGPPQQIEFFRFFLTAIQTVVPEFTGPPMNPPPLPFQLQDPQRLRQELTKAGLKQVNVKTISEKLEFVSGQQLLDWLVNSNPIVGTVLAELHLASGQLDEVRQALDQMIRERKGDSGRAVLTNPINLGVGTK